MILEKKTTKPGSLTFKGRPLVRSGNTIYYGDPGDDYVAMLQILAEEPFQETRLPSRVSVQIWATDDTVKKTLEIHGRHDPCILTRATVVLEAAAALAALEVLS